MYETLQPQATLNKNFRSTFFFNTLFGSLNHFGQNVLHLVPKQKRQKRRRKLYKWDEIFKQTAFEIMIVLSFNKKNLINHCHWFRDGRIYLDVNSQIKFKNILLWMSTINTYEYITHKLRNRIIKYLIPIYGIKNTPANLEVVKY